MTQELGDGLCIIHLHRAQVLTSEPLTLLKLISQGTGKPSSSSVKPQDVQASKFRKVSPHPKGSTSLQTALPSVE